MDEERKNATTDHNFQLSKSLWGSQETQNELRLIMESHYHQLRDLVDLRPTPRNEKTLKEFLDGAERLHAAPFINGRKLYELLMNTGGYEQAVNIYQGYHGMPGWLDGDDIPDIIDVSKELENPPPLSEELIHGILRRGHQLLLAGGAKTSKSFLALELSIAVARGEPWIDTFDCAQGPVLYINGEIDRASCDRRIMAILERKKIDRQELTGNLDIMTARGYDLTASQVVSKIQQTGKNYALIVLDPIYTLADVTDENNAAEVRRMLREVGEIVTTTGAALVAIHHHSKGQQGQKRSIDRAAGSGVFGRWFDAVLDLSVLRVPDGVATQSKTPDSTAMRIEADLRDFASPKPLSLWWHYPIHIPDASGELDGLLIDGDTRAGLKNFSDGKTTEQRQADRDAELTSAITAITEDGREPTVKAVAEELGEPTANVYRWLKESKVVTKDGKNLSISRP